MELVSGEADSSSASTERLMSILILKASDGALQRHLEESHRRSSIYGLKDRLPRRIPHVTPARRLSPLASERLSSFLLPRRHRGVATGQFKAVPGSRCLLAEMPSTNSFSGKKSYETVEMETTISAVQLIFDGTHARRKKDNHTSAIAKKKRTPDMAWAMYRFRCNSVVSAYTRLLSNEAEV